MSVPRVTKVRQEENCRGWLREAAHRRCGHERVKEEKNHGGLCDWRGFMTREGEEREGNMKEKEKEENEARVSLFSLLFCLSLL